MSFEIIVIIAFAVIVLWLVAIYNGFVKLRNRAKEAWADIDVQLKRRYDLIPNLVESVKGYASHERGVFEAVTRARTEALNAESRSDVKNVAQAENALAGTLKTLFAVSENYPELKASENFKELQRELSDTENKIQAARRFYNSNIRSLNIKVESFPYSIIANLFKFEKREFFELQEKAARENVKVSF